MCDQACAACLLLCYPPTHPPLHPCSSLLPAHPSLCLTCGGWPQDCAGRYEGNMLYENARGAVAVSALFDLDPDLRPRSNQIKGLFTRL